MDNRRFEEMLRVVLRAGLPVGAAAFRDGLLARCLAVLGSDVRDRSAGGDGEWCAAELADDDLGLLAAAGDGLTFDGGNVSRDADR